MKPPTKERIDDLIDCYGSVLEAIRARTRCIERRAKEGKDSPCAKAEVAALENLPAGYMTRREQAETLS